MNGDIEFQQELIIPADSVLLSGELTIPAVACGIVVFAHGSGSSRYSPRNRFVASVMREANLATLLLDLLTPDEEAVDIRTRHLRFDIQLLAQRLVETVEWLQCLDETRHLRAGLFGASTGGGAALVAAAQLGGSIGAVVSRGGRPDLAGTSLARVNAPVLLIVGGLDDLVIKLNEEAYAQLRCRKELTIVPGATHLFEEPGTLTTVAGMAAGWFRHYLTHSARTTAG